MLHFIILDINNPHVFCHSTNITFLIMTFEELSYLANDDVKEDKASDSQATGPYRVTFKAAVSILLTEPSYSHKENPAQQFDGCHSLNLNYLHI